MLLQDMEIFDPTAPPAISGAETLALPGAALRLYRDVALADGTTALRDLIEHTPWRQEHITLFGKTHPQPRLVAWFGDPDAAYTYSGITHEPLAWTAQLAVLRDNVSRLCGTPFNSVLLNYYRDGRDAMGLHADDEPELGRRPVIASLSVGATRRMYFRPKQKGGGSGLDLDLPDNSLLVMSGDTQEHWKHGIRRTRAPCGPRINLTFRHVLPRI